MRLSFETIKSITCGAVRIEESGEGIRFWRFTREQEKLYDAFRPETGMNYYTKCMSTSCVKLAFTTDSPWLRLKVDVQKATTRTFFTFEVKVNGALVDTLRNHEGSYPCGKPNEAFPLGEFEKEFSLGEGEKTVEVFFPWSVCPVVQEVSLADGASVTPVKRSKKLLIFGDSITQGYDILQPSQHYSVRLSDHLNAEAFNKAIGGEIFFPPLAQAKDDFQPDYITVAYGSNDFSKTDGVRFVDHCKAFYTALRQHYPKAKIFALTPIWRKDENKVTPFGSFASVEAKIRQAVAEIPGVTVIRGYDFVPHDIALFSDLRLHPNDEGFAHFAKNVISEIEKHI